MPKLGNFIGPIASFMRTVLIWLHDHVGNWGLAIVCLAACRVQQSNRRVARIVAVTAAGGYAAVSGFGVPAIRAFTMRAVAAAAMANRRPTDAFQLLALAAVLVVLGRPEATGSAGFLLSFAAVACLVWLARAEGGALTGQSRFRVAAIKTVRMQWALLAGLLPITLILFGRVSLAAPVVNLAVVPVFSLVTVPAALAGALLNRLQKL